MHQHRLSEVDESFDLLMNQPALKRMLIDEIRELIEREAGFNDEPQRAEFEAVSSVLAFFLDYPTLADDFSNPELKDLICYAITRGKWEYHLVQNRNVTVLRADADILGTEACLQVLRKGDPERYARTLEVRDKYSRLVSDFLRRNHQRTSNTLLKIDNLLTEFIEELKKRDAKTPAILRHELAVLHNARLVLRSIEMRAKYKAAPIGYRSGLSAWGRGSLTALNTETFRGVRNT